MLINVKANRLEILKGLFIKDSIKSWVIKNLIKGSREVELDGIYGDIGDVIEFTACYTDTGLDVSDDVYYKIQDDYASELASEAYQNIVCAAEYYYEGDR